MSNTYVEPVHAGEFLLSEGAGKISREAIDLAPGAALVAGQVLGQLTATGQFAPYNPEAEDQTPSLYPPYASTVKRSPREPLVRIPQTLTEVTGPGAVWERLLDRAGRDDLPALTNDADLHLIVDGVRVDASGQRNGAYHFRLPCCPKSVFIGSRASAPAELGFARDLRCLGAALRRVTIRQGAKFMLIDADDERLTAGFHEYEPAENIRWTDGYAELPIQAFARFDEGAELVVYLGGSTRYPDYSDKVADGRDLASAA